MQTLRLFIALEVSETIQKDIIKSFRRLPLHWHNYRPIPVENLHLTLKFLGETPVESIPVIVDMLSQQCENLRIPELVMDRATVMPQNNPKVISLPARSNSRLSKLFESIDNELAKHGVANTEIRQFKPHLTLARIKNGIKITDDDLTTISSWSVNWSWPADTVVLIESVLEKTGPVYNILQEYQLT